MSDVKRFAEWVRLTSALVDGTIAPEDYDRRTAELAGEEKSNG